MSEIKAIAGTDDRVPLHTVVPLSSPFALYIYPTNICNFKCNYCAHALDKQTLKAKYGMENETMSYQTFCNAIDGLGDMLSCLRVLSFVGQGEPLINKGIPEMIAYAKHKGCKARIEMISNASLLTHELSDKLVEAGLDVLRISVQGVTQEKYRQICGYSINFQKFIEGIEYFYKNKANCNVFVKVVDTALDPGDDEKFYALFNSISDRMFIEKVKPVYHGVDYTEDLDSVVVDRYGTEHEPRYVCPLPFYMAGVWPDGSVTPCDAIYKPVILGNVNDCAIENMWHSNDWKEFLVNQLKNGKNSNNRCAMCCAPDDVSHPVDVLDEYRQELINKLGG